MSAEQTALVNAFLSGAIAMGHGVAGLFFLRFWRKTADRLFVLFAAAFWVLGIIRALMLFVAPRAEETHYYWLRLVAYLIILAAIVDKNLKR
jgi:hypothetical protein